MSETSREGRIGPLTLPSLIQGLCAERRTGTLAVEDDGAVRTLYFENGRVVFATSSDPDDRLSSFFLRRGTISLEALRSAAGVIASESKRMGAVLVQMKAIRPEDLVRGVNEQVKEMVIDLFRWTRGQFTFLEGELPSKEVITLKMHTGDLIMSGIRSIESWCRIESAVGGLETRYVTSPRFDELARELNLSLEEWTLLSRCESGASLGDMCRESSLNDFEVCRVIWGFMVVGLLQKASQAAAIG